MPTLPSSYKTTPVNPYRTVRIDIKRTNEYGYCQHVTGIGYMQEEKRDKRRNQILDAFVALLIEKGYRNASMLAVARKSSASKETLYAWFNNKQGLFEAVIHRNAESVQQLLEKHQTDDSSTEEALTTFGSALLKLLLSEDAIAINRAAITAVSSEPELAEILTETGRNTTLPRFLALLKQHQRKGYLNIIDFNNAAEQYLGLLVGDLQVRRLLGVLPAPGKKAISTRVAVATAAFMQLYGTKK